MVIAEIERGLGSGVEERRWQAAIRLGEYAETEPETVWPVLARWGCSEEDDVRTALATCVLEHLLEHHFGLLFARVEELALSDRRFADTFSSCWRFGQSDQAGNAAKFEALKAKLLARGAA